MPMLDKIKKVLFFNQVNDINHNFQQHKLPADSNLSLLLPTKKS